MKIRKVVLLLVYAIMTISVVEWLDGREIKASQKDVTVTYDMSALDKLGLDYSTANLPTQVELCTEIFTPYYDGYYVVWESTGCPHDTVIYNNKNLKAQVIISDTSKLKFVVDPRIHFDGDNEYIGEDGNTSLYQRSVLKCTDTTTVGFSVDDGISLDSISIMVDGEKYSKGITKGDKFNIITVDTTQNHTIVFSIDPDAEQTPSPSHPNKVTLSRQADEGCIYTMWYGNDQFVHDYLTIEEERALTEVDTQYEYSETSKSIRFKILNNYILDSVTLDGKKIDALEWGDGQYYIDVDMLADHTVSIKTKPTDKTKRYNISYDLTALEKANLDYSLQDLPTSYTYGSGCCVYTPRIKGYYITWETHGEWSAFKNYMNLNESFGDIKLKAMVVVCDTSELTVRVSKNLKVENGLNFGFEVTDITESYIEYKTLGHTYGAPVRFSCQDGIIDYDNISFKLDGVVWTDPNIYQYPYHCQVTTDFLTDHLLVIDSGYVGETEKPTVVPTEVPKPTVVPTAVPTEIPKPTVVPTAVPTEVPKPTVVPTAVPTEVPKPTVVPTAVPTEVPKPTVVPTAVPTEIPKPTVVPTVVPTEVPKPTVVPTAIPTVQPTVAPTVVPTVEPTVQPTVEPTVTPTVQPTIVPSAVPTEKPQKKSLKVGTKVAVSGGTYKVTGKNAVSYVISNKVKDKVVIADSVMIKGKTYLISSIASKALKSNKKVTKIVIGKNVTKIGKQAFCGCKNLKSITIKSLKLTKNKTGDKAFKGIHKSAVIKVPKSKLKKYKKILKAKGIGKKVKIKKI